MRLSAERYYGLGAVIERGSVIANSSFSGVVYATQAGAGVAGKISSKLDVDGLHFTMRITGSADNLTVGAWEVSSGGVLAINNCEFNAVVGKIDSVGGSVFCGENSGAVTVDGVTGSITGPWAAWCPESCTINVTGMN